MSNAFDPGTRAPGARTLVAIVAADVAGYTRLIAEDEDGTIRRLGACSALFREVTARHQGRIFNTAGDAILAEFPSAVLALRAAVAIQEGVAALERDVPAAKRIAFRMGGTIGDVVERDGDLLGDGVNVAARLQTLAQPGGICVARSFREAVGTKAGVDFVDMGRQRLKNIAEPMPAFRVVAVGGAVATVGRQTLWTAGLVGAAVCVAALLVGVLGVPKGLTGAKAVAAPATLLPVARPALSVSVAAPKRVCFTDDVRLTGLIQPRSVVDVPADVDGQRIGRVLVQPLDAVQPGQVLAELGPAEGRADAPTQIRAPVAGTIGKSTAGQQVLTATGAPPLFQIIVGGEMELMAEVPIDTLGGLAVGQSVAVAPVGGGTVPGRVRSVARTADAGRQVVPVHVALQSGADVRWGQFASGRATIAQRCGLAVPFSAVIRGQEGAAVYVVADGAIEARPVTVGLAGGGQVEMRSGVVPGDRVVQKAGAFLREGDPVRAIDVAAP